MILKKIDMPGPHKPMSIEEVAEMNESSICENCWTWLYTR